MEISENNPALQPQNRFLLDDADSGRQTVWLNNSWHIEFAIVVSHVAFGVTPDIREGVGIYIKYKLVAEPTEKMLPVLPYAVLAAKVMSIKIATLLPSIRNVPPLCVSLHAFVHWKHKNTHRTCRKRRRNTVRKDLRLTITRTHTCRCGEGKMINTTLHKTRPENTRE